MITGIPFLVQMQDAQVTIKDGIVTKADKSFSSLTGYPVDMIINRPFADVFHIDLKATIEEKDLNDPAGWIDCFIFTSFLEPREVRIRTSQTRNHGEKIIHFKKTISKLYSSYNYAKDILANAGIALACYAVEPGIRLLAANNAYLELYDIAEAVNVLGKSIDCIIPNWRESKAGVIWDNLLQNGKFEYPDGYEYCLSDRGIRYFKSRLFPIFEKRKIKYIIEATNDITQNMLDRKLVEDQAAIIRKQKQQMEAIIQHISEGLLILDSDGRYIIGNNAANERLMMRENIQESYRPSFYYDFDGNEIAYDDLPFTRVLKGERVIDQHIALNTSNGTVYLGVSGTPVTDGMDGSVMGVLSLRDVTDGFNREQAQKETYEKLLKAERTDKEALSKEIEMKNEFISYITHEFKTPLAVINSAVQAIEYLCKDELSNQFKSFLSKIKQSSFRQLRLVNNLLDITRLNAGHNKAIKRNMDIVLLAREITESVRLYAEQKNIELVFCSEMVSKIIGIDEEKFERVMLNLLSNAIKFTPGGKKVMVVISDKTESSEKYVSVKVRDEGVGIPKEKHQVVFELFGQVENSLTRQSEGTGIGLSLVKKMVAVLGGTISLESEVGKGSAFEVLLPDMPAEEDPAHNNYEKFTDSRLIQATAIEFSDIYL